MPCWIVTMAHDTWNHAVASSVHHHIASPARPSVGHRSRGTIDRPAGAPLSPPARPSCYDHHVNDRSAVGDVARPPLVVGKSSQRARAVSVASLTFSICCSVVRDINADESLSVTHNGSRWPTHFVISRAEVHKCKVGWIMTAWKVTAVSVNEPCKFTCIYAYNSDLRKPTNSGFLLLL